MEAHYMTLKTIVTVRLKNNRDEVIPVVQALSHFGFFPYRFYKNNIPVLLMSGL